jgi:hypothetical protein
MITLIVFGEAFKLWISSLCSLLHSPATSSPCSQTPSIFVLPLVWETKFHTHTKTRKIIDIPDSQYSKTSNLDSSQAFLVVTPCGVLVAYKRFGGPWCLHLQGEVWRCVVLCYVMVGYQRFRGPCCVHLEGIKYQKTSTWIFTAPKTSNFASSSPDIIQSVERSFQSLLEMMFSTFNWSVVSFVVIQLRN